MLRISSITAKSVRGLPRAFETIKVGTQGLFVTGDNGSGKSSIVDAIEFAITRNSTLFLSNRAGVNWGTASPHVIDGVPDIRVTVSDGPRSFLVDYNETDLTDSDSLRAWLDSARRSKFVLRRNQLLQFIDSDAADRYRVLERFLNLDSFNAIEKELEKRTVATANELNACEAELHGACERIKAVYGQESVKDSIDDSIILTKINESLTLAEISKCDDKNNLTSSLSELKEALSTIQVSKELQLLSSLKQQIQILLLPSIILPPFKTFRDAVRDFESRKQEAVKSYWGNFLKMAKDIIDRERPEFCPVCESSIDAERLVNRLTSRIKEDEAINSAMKRVECCSESLLRIINPGVLSANAVQGHWSEVVEDELPQAFVAYSDVLSNLQKSLNTKRYPLAYLNEVEEFFSSLTLPNHELITLVDRQLQLLDSSVRAKAIAESIRQIESFLSDDATVQQSKQKLKRLRKDGSNLQRLHNHSVSARKETVQSILDNVASKANDYYGSIHKDENLGGSQLEVREKVKGSLNLTSEFNKKLEPPLLHYSESHLDTLGLCYFLAIRKLEAIDQPDFRLLVLDDVLHSVDASHRDRIARLIHAEFSDHQIILTTHDPIFFKKLRLLFGRERTEYIEITEWDLRTGPKYAATSNTIDSVTVASIRSTKRSDELASDCGKFAESLFMDIAVRLQFSIRATYDSRHTLADLWPKISSKFRRMKGYMGKHPDIIDSIENSQWVRNEWGGHYNETPSPPTHEESNRLAEALTQFHFSVFCSSCGKYISLRENGDWSCACNHLHYTKRDTDQAS